MGRGDFHLLEAKAGLGSEGQETDFTCCSASDLRESHPGRTHSTEASAPFCPEMKVRVTEDRAGGKERLKTETEEKNGCCCCCGSNTDLMPLLSLI